MERPRTPTLFSYIETCMVTFKTYDEPSTFLDAWAQAHSQERDRE